MLRFRPFHNILKSKYFATVSATNSNGIDLQKLELAKSPKEIAHRLVSSHLLVTRWALEMQERESKKEKANSEYKASDAHESLSKCLETLDWTSKSGKFTEYEEMVMKMPLGEWKADEHLYGLEMRWETLGMLLWILRIIKEVPRYDQLFTRQDIYAAPALLPAMPNTLSTFLEYFESGHGTKPDHIITPHEMWRQVSIGESWLWRARAQKVLDLNLYFREMDDIKQKQYDKIPKSLKDVMKHIAEAIDLGSSRALEEEFITSTLEGDFNVEGVKYADLSDHRIRDLHRIAEARINTLKWACGKGDWEYVEGEVGFINPVGSIWAPE